nr:MAG TPA: hypothetical protein [Caudoviricetes sp.]
MQSLQSLVSEGLAVLCGLLGTTALNEETHVGRNLAGADILAHAESHGLGGHRLVKGCESLVNLVKESLLLSGLLSVLGLLALDGRKLLVAERYHVYVVGHSGLDGVVNLELGHVNLLSLGTHGRNFISSLSLIILYYKFSLAARTFSE